MSTERSILLTTDLPLVPFIRGKVRDTYHLGSHLLIVASDRISAFDVVLPCGIPNKGSVLNQLSSFWFARTAPLISDHLLEVIDNPGQLDTYLDDAERFLYPDYLKGRSMVVKKAKRIPIECVVRGFLSGSAWEEYKNRGAVSGVPLPEGLLESQELPRPLFTPTTKAEKGHDLPLLAADVEGLVGKALAHEIEEKSLAVYNYARRYAASRGFIIADTKLEFGLDGEELILIDELLTPDSSRFWDIEQYQVGQPQDSFDKQPVRDWLTSSGWNKEPPAPILPSEVIEQTSQRYLSAFERLTGHRLK